MSCQGMGGRMSRAVPICFPVRRALTNSSSVHTPLRRPVRGSGVRLAANETPHGPLQAVKCSLVAAIHDEPDAGWNGALTLAPSGCPDSSLSTSGSGPFGPYFLGE